MAAIAIASAVAAVSEPTRAAFCIDDCELAPILALPLHNAIPPAGVYTIGTIGVAAVAPMIATIVLGHELTPSELWHIEMSVVLGPFGWMLADQMFPPGHGAPAGPPSSAGGGGANINLPLPGQFFFVPNEVVLEVDSGTSASYLVRLARRLGLSLLETQRFALTGRSILRFHINNGRSVISILRSLGRYARIAAAQPNYLYLLQQGAPAVTREAAPDSGIVQYVVDKLRLREAHAISSGDDVPVALIDSQVDAAQPELAGSIVDEFDAVGPPATPHSHGTAIAGAIAAHAKLLGVAPKVKLMIARVFSGSGDSAQGTTFNILKGIDWAASRKARVINMSFAGPNDPMIRNMIAKAHARGIVLVAAVGNAGPRARPLYPAAYPNVIGVTATDIDDKLMTQANRGRQVTISAPGVEIVEPAPADSYQIISGTSIAAAHVSGVAALLLAEDPKLTPNDVKRILTGSAHALHLPALEAGAGEIDALSALRAIKK